MLPNLNKYDMKILKGLRDSHPIEFNSNVTKFYLSEMDKYVSRLQVWRITIMGETRSGKSEVGCTNALIYKKKFNYYLKLGAFKKMLKSSDLKIGPIDFNEQFIMGSQSEYIYTLRESQNNKKLQFGQIWQIDEDRGQAGGMGLFSEQTDLKNLNNIAAKFMQSEIWITPIKFQTRNAPYGLYVYHKDIETRVNWCLLYKIQMTAKASSDYFFMGWVAFQLHNDEKLRKKYETKKDGWIRAEIDGNVDERTKKRKEFALLLSSDERFKMMSHSGKNFVLSKEQQMSIIEDYIIKGDTQRWNENEKYRIMSEARMIVTCGIKSLEEKDESEKNTRTKKLQGKSAKVRGKEFMQF